MLPKGAYNTTLGDYRFEVLTLASIVDTMSESVCPSLLASDTFCDVLMGKMTPLMFPYLFPKLDHAIFVDRYKSNYQMASSVIGEQQVQMATIPFCRTMLFQDNIGKLWNVLRKMRSTEREAIAAAPEQTNLYMRAFAGWQRVNPTTR